MTRGPQQQRLRDYLDGANEGDLRDAALQWNEGQNLLRTISDQLDRMSGDMATSDDEEFQGATADAARTSFVTSARAMTNKADQLKQGSEAFEQSAEALRTAFAERDALAQNDGARPPDRPSTPPGSTEPADVRAQRDYHTANAAYWDKYRADEQRATDAMTALDQKHTAAAEVFKSIHGEPDPVAPGGGAGGGAGGGTTPSGGGGAVWGNSSNPVWVPTNDGPDGPADDGGDDDGAGPNDVPVPTGTGEPIPGGDPTGPTGPTGPSVPSTPVGVGSGPTTGSGGVSAPAAGGGLAAGLGVGVAGGLAGGVAGGLAFPGTVAGTGGGASGGRGIGAGGPRGAGSSVLGRGNGIAGVGNGAGTGTRGNGRARGRVGVGGTPGRGTGSGGTRGAAGSRGMLGAPGTGRGPGSGRGRDKRRRGEEHDLFDDGQDWLDDDGAYEGVID